MQEVLFWIYIANAVTLTVHEIDSAYWHEWELFRLPGGIGGFLALHFPLLFAVVYGAVLVREETSAGLVISLVLALGGLFAFTIHSYFIRKGRTEFDTVVSRGILVLTLLLSVVQLPVTVYLFLR